MLRVPAGESDRRGSNETTFAVLSWI